jgi:hypothetical protein
MQPLKFSRIMTVRLGADSVGDIYNELTQGFKAFIENVCTSFFLAGERVE